MKQLTYDEVCNLVGVALNDPLTWNLAVALTRNTNRPDVIVDTANLYYSVIDGLNESDEKFEEPVDHVLLDFLKEELDNENVPIKGLREAEFFENGAEAEEQGYYWFDEIDSWLRLFFK